MADALDAKGVSVPLAEYKRKLLDYVAHELGVHFEIQRYPWRRALMMAENGEGLIFGISENAERKKIFQFSRPIYSKYVWLVTRSDAKFKYNSLTDLKGKSIGIVNGVDFGDAFNQQKNVLFTVEADTNSATSRFNKLIKRRMDAMVVTARTSDAKKLEKNIQRRVTRDLHGSVPEKELAITVLRKPLFKDQLHFAVLADKDDGIIKKIDAAIIKGKKLGLLDTDTQKFM